ncbi:MAG: hypothetical protein Q7U47_15950 [Paludibacter sp.]|nr:hypothetical protein [Paludibacter sp.]
MGKNFNRREFLRSSFLGFGTLFVISSPLKLFAAKNPATNDDLTIDAVLLNKQAKEFFYKKQYSEATQIYQQLITLFPDHISYYDGYAKVLGAQQKTLEVAELYRQGLMANSQAPLFMHRLSLRMVDLCTGNKKAELAFVNKYGENNIMEASALLLLQAITLLKKSNKGLYFNLRDIINIIDRRNKVLSDNGELPLKFPDNIKNQVLSATSLYENMWTVSRQSKKPLLTENGIEAEINNITNKQRRVLSFDAENKEREKTIKKEKKERWKLGLERNITNSKPSEVEKYATFILEENITDTDTIGKLRSYYKKNKHHNRLLSLNRYLYIKNSSLANSLALATSLSNYGNNASDLAEAGQLLSTIAPYVNTLTPVSIGAYYQTRAQLLNQINQSANARIILLEGIGKFEGKGGVSYSFFENYAQTFNKKNLNTGLDLMKALCGKEVKPIDDPVWKYVTAYLKDQKGKTISVAEQLKPLYTLAKLQKKAGSSEYSTTKSEIETLRSKIY